MKLHMSIMNIQSGVESGAAGENVTALWKDGRGMQAVEIEATEYTRHRAAS